MPFEAYLAISGIRIIHILATDFIIAPTQPPANGPNRPTKGILSNSDKKAGLNPNRNQHIIQGTATKSIRIYQGVRKIGGRHCRITERTAMSAAPESCTVGLFTLIVVIECTSNTTYLRVFTHF